MGQPQLQGVGIGALGYINIVPETTWGGIYTTLGGASATIASGTTTLTLVNPGNASAGMYIYFDDGSMPSSQAEYPNNSEPPIQISSIAGSVITLASATTQNHYGPQSASAPQSGSRVHIAYKPTKGLYYDSQSLLRKTNPWETKIIAASRIGTRFMLQGMEQVGGNIVSHVGPGWGSDLLVGAFGSEQETYATATGSATLAAATAIGATSFTTTGSFTVGNIAVVDATPNREMRKVTAVTGTGTFTVTVDKAFRFAHASAATVQVASGSVYTHAIQLGNVLPSFAIEKFISADVQFNTTQTGVEPNSFGYTGLYVDQLTLKEDNKEGPIATFAMKGQGETLIPATLAGAYPIALPYTFDQIIYTVNGTQDVTVTDFELTVKNSIKEIKTLDSTRKVSVLRPGVRTITGKLSYYYAGNSVYSKMVANTPDNLVFNWYQPATGYSMTLTLTKCVYTSFNVKDGFDSSVMVDAEFIAELDTGTSVEGNLVLMDGNYLNYGI